MLAAAAARSARRPLVVTRRAAFPLRRAAAWRQADRVIAISEAVRAQLLTDGIDPERIVVVRSAIDLAAVAGARPGGFRASLALADESPLIAAVAALTPEKGLDILVAAAARLAEHTPKIHWVVAGAGPLAGDLNRAAARSGVGDTVHLLGHLDDPTALLAEADCVVMPSRSEAFGSSLLDAMALGKPIVASAVGGIPEVLGSAGVVVPPGNPAALAAAVVAITGDPAAAARLGAAAKLRVQEFGADRMARAMVAVYRSVAQID
jgi:glycosyltransferase involved in cell wall biosynthesis